MTSITVRNIEDDLKRRLRIRAAEHGHSMEEEARRILRTALGDDEAPPEKGLATQSTSCSRRSAAWTASNSLSLAA